MSIVQVRWLESVNSVPSVNIINRVARSSTSQSDLGSSDLGSSDCSPVTVTAPRMMANPALICGSCPEGVTVLLMLTFPMWQWPFDMRSTEHPIGRICWLVKECNCIAQLFIKGP